MLTSNKEKFLGNKQGEKERKREGGREAARGSIIYRAEELSLKSRVIDFQGRFKTRVGNVSEKLRADREPRSLPPSPIKNVSDNRGFTSNVRGRNFPHSLSSRGARRAVSNRVRRGARDSRGKEVRWIEIRY